MIIIYHNGRTVVELNKSYRIDKLSNLSIVESLMLLAKEYPDVVLVWCNISLKEQLNILEIEQLFHHQKLLLSYNPSETLFLEKSIGYVEESPFIKINKSVTFPTWQMSSIVGGVHSSILNALEEEVAHDKDFNYFLSSIAKLAMRKGLLSYSEPKLLKKNTNSLSTKTSTYILFRFVKQHYKTQWVFLLLLNILLYERKFPVVPFICSLFYRNRSKININLDSIIVQSSKKVMDKKTIDVIIPTIGRSNYLYNVLKDFSRQTLLPSKIIIVEQNPIELSKTQLDYIQNEKWPFEIQHFFIHQSGVCNARNLALDQTESEWVFLADDDNRFDPNLLENVFEKIEQYGNLVVTTAYPQKNEFKSHLKVIQWPTFGAGNSFVRRDILGKIRFNTALEFGYGEDVDFGMKLRNQGHDVLYLPEPEIQHLKAPVGGFRTKPELQWDNDTVQPKPSPTIMLYQISHQALEQVRGYKTILFFKFYKHQAIKNPIRYIINYRKQWKRSVFWANELKKAE